MTLINIEAAPRKALKEGDREGQYYEIESDRKVYVKKDEEQKKSEVKITGKSVKRQQMDHSASARLKLDKQIDET